MMTWFHEPVYRSNFCLTNNVCDVHNDIWGKPYYMNTSYFVFNESLLHIWYHLFYKTNLHQNVCQKCAQLKYPLLVEIHQLDQRYTLLTYGVLSKYLYAKSAMPSGYVNETRQKFDRPLHDYLSVGDPCYTWYRYSPLREGMSCITTSKLKLDPRLQGHLLMTLSYQTTRSCLLYFCPFTGGIHFLLGISIHH